MTFDIPDDIHREVSVLILGIADDDFFTGNRLARWVGSGPTLEEDNALSAIQQDEIGHARLWYEFVSSLDGRSVDELGQDRPIEDRRNSVLVEPDLEDFAHTIVRSFLYDRAEHLLVGAIRDGEMEELSARAETVLHEEVYHREHAEQWLSVLTSTEEGRQRIGDAFSANLPNGRDYFAFDPGIAETLTEERVIARPFGELEADWIDGIAKTVDDLAIDITAEDVREVMDEPPELVGRRGEHFPEFAEVVGHLYPTPEEIYPESIQDADDLRYAEKVGLNENHHE